MSDVKWIKVRTDLFEDEKMMLLQKLPKSDTLIVIWIKLLCLAGKLNQDGLFLLTSDVPYDYKMLSTVLQRKENVIRNAVEVFQKYGMINIDDNGVISITNWNKHQSLQGFEGRKEYMREYMKERRSKQNVNNVNVNSKPNVNLLEEDKEEDIDKEKIKKHIYGEYEHVRLTDSERDKLFNEFGEIKTIEAIKYLDEYIEMKGYKARSHYLAMRKWVFKAVDEEKGKQKPQTLAEKWGLA